MPVVVLPVARRNRVLIPLGFRSGFRRRFGSGFRRRSRRQFLPQRLEPLCGRVGYVLRLGSLEFRPQRCELLVERFGVSSTGSVFGVRVGDHVRIVGAVGVLLGRPVVDVETGLDGGFPALVHERDGNGDEGEIPLDLRRGAVRRRLAARAVAGRCFRVGRRVGPRLIRIDASGG